MKVIYIAGPYNGDIDMNIAKARRMAVKLWEHGFIALCPHLNTANFEQVCQAPEHIFLEGYLELLKRCDGIILLEGWLASKGSISEANLASELEMPIFHNFDQLLGRIWEE